MRSPGFGVELAPVAFCYGLWGIYDFGHRHTVHPETIQSRIFTGFRRSTDGLPSPPAIIATLLTNMSAPKLIGLDVCLFDYMFQTIGQMVMVGPTT